MPRKKRYEVKIEVMLPKELADFLEDMVRAGHVETLSSAVRRCIAIAKEYLPTAKLEIKKVEEGKE